MWLVRNKQIMKKIDPTTEDELRPEYDLRSLRVRRVGRERRTFGGQLVALDPDVAALFPDSAAVNEALRFLARITRENQPKLVEG